MTSSSSSNPRGSGKRSNERRPLLKQQQLQAAAEARNNRHASPRASSSPQGTRSAPSSPQSNTPTKSKRRNRWFGVGDSATLAQQQESQQTTTAPQPTRQRSKKDSSSAPSTPKGHKSSRRLSGSSRKAQSSSSSSSKKPPPDYISSSGGEDEEKRSSTLRNKHRRKARSSAATASTGTTAASTLPSDDSATSSSVVSSTGSLSEHNSYLQEAAAAAAGAGLEPHNQIVHRQDFKPSHREAEEEEEKKSEDPEASSLATANHSKKALLTRPFGREFLVTPPQAPQYSVEVSAAEWDGDEQKWKYHVVIQQQHKSVKQAPAPSKQQPFAQAFTWRSLDDFIWLEESLRLEFQGALLVPLLSISLGAPVPESSGPVEAAPLQDWLYDLLNGIRGQGEWSLLPHARGGTTPPLSPTSSKVNVLESEAVEAFLYKHNGPLVQEEVVVGGPTAMVHSGLLQQRARQGLLDPQKSSSTQHHQKSPTNVRSPMSCLDDRQSSFVQQVFHKSLELFPHIGELCIGPDPAASNMTSPAAAAESALPTRRGSAGNPQLQQPQQRLPYSSRALGTATSLEILDSFAENNSLASPRYSSGLAIHSELIEAEKDLLLNYRITALSAMDKCQVLTETEETIGGAWKRLAVAIANVFTYEKDVEHAKLGDLKVKKDSLLYRKLTKSTVDDCLRAVAKQKLERSVPSLKLLQDMLAAYIADLSAVQPSVDVYFAAVENLTILEEQHNERSPPGKPLRGSRKAPSPRHNNGNNEDDNGWAQRRAYQQQVLLHERQLGDSLTLLCKATPLRVARMVWWYMKTEASQCASLHAAAAALRTKSCVATKEAVSEMEQRHLKAEQEDNEAEMDLARRIVQLRFFQQKQDDANHQQRVEEIAQKREHALQLVQKRLGRWDAKVGWSIMEAVGIDDPVVRMEDATKDLKLVHKYAAGLQECLKSCADAIGRVRSAVTAIATNTGDSPIHGQGFQNIADVRKSFLFEISKLFSGRFVNHDGGRMLQRSAMPSVSVLSRAGVDMSDPLGWTESLAREQKQQQSANANKTLSNAYFSYLLAKDHQTEWLLSSLANLLKDYHDRVETVEGFLYMQCVGIKLEKSFNEKRTKALTAFERKTDITSAMNVATRKRLPHLVKELQAKLDTLGPDVSHTLVKETKELHLESKSLKTELQDLAVRRLQRAREASTEKAIALMSFWAKEEESCCASELKALGEAMSLLEKHVCG